MLANRDLLRDTNIIINQYIIDIIVYIYKSILAINML